MKVGKLEDVRRDGAVVAQGIAVFFHRGELFAIDNRCPHLGFPLDKGTVKDGVLTCHWHHWRFDMATGGCFTAGGDDVRVYPVEVRDGEVHVDTRAAVGDPARRFGKALEQNNTLAIAKSIIRLLEAGFTPVDLVRRIARFGVQFRNDWSSGMSVLSALARILPAERPLLVLALTHAARAVAASCEGQPPRRARDPLPGKVSFDELKAKFRLFVGEREAAGAERCLITALRSGAAREQAADMLVSAATDHVYIDEGHPFYDIHAALELLDVIGWESAPDLLPLLVAPIAKARWYEEETEWRYPFDFPAAIANLAPGTAVDETALLTDDPKRLVEALAGVTPAALAAAASIRMARYNLKNEIFDWENAHHAYVYARAVTGLPLFRAAVHGAVKNYLVRFLTIPPARLPWEVPVGKGDLEGMKAAVGAKRVTDAAHALYAYVRDGGDRARLQTALLDAALREDVDFHGVQSLEAGIALSRMLAGTPHENVPLVATVRYLAIHGATDRFVSSTVDKALRLERGEELFLEE